MIFGFSLFGIDVVGRMCEWVRMDIQMCILSVCMFDVVEYMCLSFFIFPFLFRIVATINAVSVSFVLRRGHCSLPVLNGKFDDIY